jgi:hypothetical protein
MTGHVSDGASWRPFVSGGFTVGTPAGNKAVDVGYVSDGTTWRIFYQRQLAAPTGFACTNPGAHPVDLTWAWNAVPNATSYNLYYRVNNTGSWIHYGSTAGTTYSTPGCSADIAYGWCVTASAAGATTSEVSNVVQIATGHYEQRNINSFQYVMNPATSSWRQGGSGVSGGWGQYGGDNVFQGAYGSSGYYDGVMTHNATQFMDWCRNNYGQQVLDHIAANPGAWTECAVYLQRVPGSGYTPNHIAPHLHMSNAVVWQTNGPHTYVGGYDGFGLTDTQGGWFFLPVDWARNVLLNQVVGGIYCNSFMAEYDTHDQYCQWYGASYGGAHTQLSARASWNFVTVNQQNSYYW